MTDIGEAFSRAGLAVEAGDFGQAWQAYKELVEATSPSMVVIGDSHVHSYHGVSSVLPIWLGPVTMHRVGRDDGNLIDLNAMGIASNTLIVFGFGEIDARQHLHPQADAQGRSIEDISAEMVKKYLDVVARLTEGRDRDSIYIATTVPPHDIPPESKHAFVNAPPLEQRRVTAVILNATIKKRARESGFPVLDIYGLLKNEHDFLPDELTEDDIHIYAPPGRQKLHGYLFGKFGLK